MENEYNINLMPHQWEEFNGDYFVAEQFLFMKEKYNIKTAVELGTCLGSSAIWFAKNFEKVITIEISVGYASIANKRIIKENLENIQLYVGDTVAVLPEIIHDINDDSIFFIDSHWGNECPMLKELQIIAKRGIKPVIVIHDFKVPNEPALGFDDIHGQPFEWAWIKPYIDAIYGVDGYLYYYNSNEKSTEIKRGVIYICKL